MGLFWLERLGERELLSMYQVKLQRGIHGIHIKIHPCDPPGEGRQMHIQRGDAL